MSLRNIDLDVSNNPLAIVVTRFCADKAGTAPGGRHLLWIKVPVLPLSNRTWSSHIRRCPCTVQTIIIVIGTRSRHTVLLDVFGVGNRICVFIATVHSSGVGPRLISSDVSNTSFSI